MRASARGCAGTAVEHARRVRAIVLVVVTLAGCGLVDDLADSGDGCGPVENLGVEIQSPVELDRLIMFYVVDDPNPPAVSPQAALDGGGVPAPWQQDVVDFAPPVRSYHFELDQDPCNSVGDPPPNQFGAVGVRDLEGDVFAAASGVLSTLDYKPDSGDPDTSYMANETLVLTPLD